MSTRRLTSPHESAWPASFPPDTSRRGYTDSVKTYLLVDAETREPMCEYVTGDDNTLQAGTHIASESSGDARTWEILANVEGDDERPVALVRPAPGPPAVYSA